MGREFWVIQVGQEYATEPSVKQNQDFTHDINCAVRYYDRGALYDDLREFKDRHGALAGHVTAWRVRVSYDMSLESL
jgi:hypothetical protein